MWTLTLPRKVEIGSGKIISLNLNTYRNLHHYQNNAAKVAFKGSVIKPLQELRIPPQLKVHLQYTLFRGDKRRIDLMNACVVVDKFFSDVLTDAGIITDDHSEIVVSTSFTDGGIDTKNPRIEVTIFPVTEPVTLSYN